MLYDILLDVPCESQERLKIWWEMGRRGYHLECQNGFVRLFGFDMNIDELEYAQEWMKKHPGSTIFHTHSRG